MFVTTKADRKGLPWTREREGCREVGRERGGEREEEEREKGGGGRNQREREMDKWVDGRADG